MTPETQIIIGMAAAWFAACGVYAIACDLRRFFQSVSPEHLPRGDRQHFADQRLERRGFAERGNNQPHGSVN